MQENSFYYARLLNHNLTGFPKYKHPRTGKLLVILTAKKQFIANILSKTKCYRSFLQKIFSCTSQNWSVLLNTHFCNGPTVMTLDLTKAQKLERLLNLCVFK